ncbi:MAG: glycoside hydrolase family 15 protein [Marinifilaceae bacterium]
MKNLNYGVVGNCRSAALISEKGSLDWMCLPQFDSASVFAKILDEKKGGSFEVIPSHPKKIDQFYLERTNILITRYYCEDGAFEIQDFMPRYKTDNQNHYAPPDLVRFFVLLEGVPEITLIYDPKLEYAKSQTYHELEGNYIKSYTKMGDYDSLYLYTSFDREDILGRSKIKLDADKFCLLAYHQKLLPQNHQRIYLKLQRTKVYWLNLAEKTTVFNNYNDQIIRSALLLKLLSFRKSGAVLAALTTSLPETIGEVRNWDYRFCWIRDASMVVKIMTQLGHLNVARGYLKFVIDILPKKSEKFQIMYGINGEKKLTERELEHLSGYENSRPVRVGNAAYMQKQNDIYGILMDVIHQHFEMFETSLEHSEELWTIVRNIMKVVEENWQKPDRGIWEIRNEERHFTFSKVLCWVAVDRAIKIANLLKMELFVEPWMALRDEIKEDVLKNAWSDSKMAFVQSYGSEDLDASVLLMEPYGFISAEDDRYESTVLSIHIELEQEGLMFRYRNQDDFGTPSSAFTICTFWLINSLYKIGRKRDARRKFEKLQTYANHLGLFSEDIDFESKRMLGNFPQAYSHLALIETAILLSEEEEVESPLFDSLEF